MKRQQRTVRCITPRGDGYVDRSVTGMMGGGKPPHITKEVIHGRYVLIKRVGAEDSFEDRNEPPQHDAKWLDPSDFTYHYLKRIS